MFMLPNINDKKYLFDKEVIIIKVFHVFHLAEVRYLDSSHSFIIDYNALQDFLDRSSSISIKLLDGVK